METSIALHFSLSFMISARSCSMLSLTSSNVTPRDFYYQVDLMDQSENFHPNSWYQYTFKGTQIFLIPRRSDLLSAFKLVTSLSTALKLPWNWSSTVNSCWRSCLWYCTRWNRNVFFQYLQPLEIWTEDIEHFLCSCKECYSFFASFCTIRTCEIQIIICTTGENTFFILSL